MVTFLQSNNMNNILPSLLKNIMEHVAHSITFKWTSNGRPFGRLKWMFFPNLCPYSCKKIIGISCQHPLPHGGVIGNKDFMYLSNNTFHSHGGLIYLKIDLRDKTKCSRFARKAMSSNFEGENNSQFWSVALVHHPSTLGSRVSIGSKGQRLSSLPTFLLHQMFK